MKRVFVLLAVSIMAGPALGATTWTDDFNGSFDQTWHWFSDGDGAAQLSGTELNLYSPTGYGAQFAGGFIPEFSSVDTFVSAEVNSQGASIGNDQGVMCRVQDTLESYILNYDPYLDKITLLYVEFFDNGGQTHAVDLARDYLALGSGQTVLLKMWARDINGGSAVQLIGEAWNPADTTRLGEIQCIIDGSTTCEGVPMPILGAGSAGAYTDLNGNEPTLSPLNTNMDDFLAIANVPEPAMVSLLGFGAVVLLLRRRRK